MSDKKVFKSFKEFAKDYLKEYDDANFAGIGGFSIGSMDSMKPDADLGDIGPTNQGLGDMRGTVAQYPQSKIPQNIKKDRFQRLEDEQVDVSQIHTHISGLHYNDKQTAEHGIKRIEDSGHEHEHKIHAANVTADKAKIASNRAKDEETKANLMAAHHVYKSYADLKKKQK
jgi:hypothetical protein